MTTADKQNGPPRTVAILCASKKTAYREIPDLEIYDEVRDARTFTGDMPVIAHPPCRRWTKFGMAMTKARFIRCGKETPQDEIDAERELGLFCTHMVMKNGGILEQPAGSKLFTAARLPLPGSMQSPHSFTVEVWQKWWGYPVKKATWLYFRGIPMTAIEIPFVLWNPGPREMSHWYNDGKGSGRSNTHTRSMTVPSLAEWLVNLARKTESGNP